jgi:riboflavin synthase
MFTGIVEETGEIRSALPGRLVVACRGAPASRVGDSIAVNGVCLTVVDAADGTLAFDVSPETRSRTALGALEAGSRVNLERPVTLSARLGGHLVQGHVDGVGSVTAVEPDDEGGAVVVIRLPEDLARYLVEKGSLAVDGVSLTVAGVEGDAVRIALIPHTRTATTLGGLHPGDAVNVEIDVIARYVERLMERTDR